MGEYYIELKKVRKTFGEEEVLKELDWKMETGKVYGIVGNNGSGKTVLMKCICGFLPVSGGSVLVEENTWDRRWIFQRVWE